MIRWIQSANWGIYPSVLEMPTIQTGLRNSLIQATVGLVYALFINSFAAYPLSKKRLWGRKWFTFYFLVTFVFAGGIVPTYLLIRALFLYNTIWSIIIPTAFSAWHMIMMRTFFLNVPDELEEAAQVEGANDLYIFFRIYMPLSKALYATMALFFVIIYWNSWVDALFYLSDKNKFPLQLIVRNMFFTSRIEPEVNSTAAAILIIMMMPLISIYPFAQKYLVKGTMIGSIKG